MSQSSPRFEDDHIDEETPFLPKDDTTRKPTPLPRLQIAVLVSIWLFGSITTHSISPYINQLVKELPIVGGDERKVGYYTGIIVSARFATEAATVLHWNRLSDHIGRKPVLLLCLIGEIVSLIAFGLSRSFWALVFMWGASNRALDGAFKGHVGTMKTVMAELTDETNAARGFSMLPMTWSLGYAIGSVMSSEIRQRAPPLKSKHLVLSWEACYHDRKIAGQASFPTLFGLNIHISFRAPWLLPVVALRSPPIPVLQRPVQMPLEKTLASISHPLPPKGLEKPPPLRSILTRPVLISISSYAMLALLVTAGSCTYPTSLVDVGRVRWAGTEPSIHWVMDVWLRMHKWHRPIRPLSTPCVTLRSAECHSYQRLDVRDDLRHIPIREFGAPSRL
ncbi:major facilitator superfamily domain-containing protein [Lactarius vividus]|nr:major facilitator superfamily domain-containing protein [Lactarius vividus]